MGQLGLPPDAIAWSALALAVVCLLAQRLPRLVESVQVAIHQHYQKLLIVLACSAALLSLGYFAYYLRGGARIIDATAYLQEARTFAAGKLTHSPSVLSTAARGRFLYFEPLARTLGVLFPPGYPALLAVSLWLGSPVLLGAVVAAMLVWFTAKLTERLFDCRVAAVVAGTLSATNASLRYHTADTMSHGVTAWLIVVTLYYALGDKKREAAFSGLAFGWLVATRPVSAMAVGVALAFQWLTTQRNWEKLAVFVALATPGVVLWLAYQRATTGSAFYSTQLAYYSVADGPPGCFRYGFGKAIGCLFEHGGYVEKRLPNGYGPFQALYVTLLRLRWHSLDVLNFEPLYLLVLIALGKAFRDKTARFVALTVPLLTLAYLPFYFDGSYPGGGARLLSDVIPLEHALLAYPLICWGTSRWLIPLSLMGFAVHGAFEHQLLKERDGGRPMFEPAALARNNVERGLIFVDTDHGFLLGHDPAVTDPHRHTMVVRHHADAHDRVLWEQLGRPPAWHYQFDPSARQAMPTVALISPAQLLQYSWFEAEAEWPPLSVSHGWVRPVFPPNDCTSSLRGLSFEPVDGRSQASILLPVERDGIYRLRIGWVARRTGAQDTTVTVAGRTFGIHRDAQNHQCFETAYDNVPLSKGEAEIIITTGALGIVLDRYRIE